MTQPATDNLRELYRELILDHARQPRHFGRPEHFTHQAEGINPLCGDKLHVYLNLEDGAIREAAFEGSGCAISMASASLLTETVRTCDAEKAVTLAADVQAMLGGETTGQDLGELQALAGVREFPSRVKCAALAWRALTAALDNTDARVSTE
ncbi:MAG: SUF system NifU family Fe-S cluster assembly protein [Gammaproteobacteria bacterium]|jgi:nitrogen fixation NifU-like protein